MRTYLRPIGVIGIVAIATNCMTVSEQPGEIASEQIEAVDSDGSEEIESTLVAVVDAPDTDPERSHYEINVLPGLDHPMELVGYDQEGNAASRLSARTYADVEGEPVILIDVEDDDFAFQGEVRVEIDPEGREVVELSGNIDGTWVAIRVDTRDPTHLMVFGLGNAPETVFGNGYELDFHEDPKAQQLFATLGRFAFLQNDLEELDLRTEGMSFRASSSCLSCIFQVGAILGGSVACIAAIAGLSVCSGGPLTAPACVGVIGAVGAACGATSGVIATFLDNCYGACSMSGAPGRPVNIPDCV